MASQAQNASTWAAVARAAGCAMPAAAAQTKLAHVFRPQRARGAYARATRNKRRAGGGCSVINTPPGASCAAWAREERCALRETCFLAQLRGCSAAAGALRTHVSLMPALLICLLSLCFACVPVPVRQPGPCGLWTRRSGHVSGHEEVPRTTTSFLVVTTHCDSTAALLEAWSCGACRRP